MSKNNEIIPNFDEKDVNELNIRLDKFGEKHIVMHLSGFIDTYNSISFQSKVNLVIAAGFKNLIFHFGSLNYVSSAGIGAFVGFLKSVKSKDGDIVFLGIQPRVYEVFQLLGFTQFFNIVDNLDEAIEKFSKRKIDPENIFPKIFRCPICSRKLKALKAGRYRCSDCKTIFTIDNSGKIFLG